MKKPKIHLLHFDEIQKLESRFLCIFKISLQGANALQKAIYDKRLNVQSLKSSPISGRTSSLIEPGIRVEGTSSPRPPAFLFKALQH